ncbi:MAG TPA: hypothetical protein ENL35_10950 [Chloroflexi bacterium]|nr:hypothetical protein [Chloroflexota bacterium]
MRTANRHRLSRRWLAASAGGIVLLSGVAWAQRVSLHTRLMTHPSWLSAALVFMTGLLGSAALGLLADSRHRRMTWRRRVAAATALEKLAPPLSHRRFLHSLRTVAQAITKPLWKTRMGARLDAEWRQASMPGGPGIYLLMLGLSAAMGYLLGLVLAGWLLGATLALLSPLAPRAWVRGRSERYKSRFDEQLPFGIETLASGLAAGLSFEQAIAYAEEDLQEPARGRFARVTRWLSLGRTLEEALGRLADTRADDSLALFVDGILLRRQFGGNLVQMLEETASLLRERLELEREVRAVTAQGRFSGIVLAALVPVSAGFLLAFNPTYIRILFDTWIGQLCLVIALILQIAGWAIISRLIRIRY